MEYVQIVVIIVILIVLVMLYFRRYYDSNELIRRKQVNETIQWLYRAVNDICYRCNMHPVYNIIETNHITYTDKVTNPHNIKGTIYLVIWNEESGCTFQHNTLIYAMLHEIAHILSPSIHHEPPFNSIEQILINTATDLGYYDPQIQMESNYMTLDLSDVMKK